MASVIEAVKRQALITFANKLPSSFENNLTKLKLLTSKITSTDVKLDKSLLSINSDSKYRTNCKKRLAPVTYIEVFENSDISISIFVLRSGARLPLHDHPLMYGILKVIYGTVRICSYSHVSSSVFENENERFGDAHNSSAPFEPSKVLYKAVSLFAIKEPEVMLCEKEEACVLCPRQSNIHEIHPVNGPAAFLDILAPPYETDIPGVGPRTCRYYKDVTQNESFLKTLVRIPIPVDYWNDYAPYQGPPFESEK